MIGYLRGTIAEIAANLVILDVNGVGYNIFIPTDFAGKLSTCLGEVKIYTYTHVKEDALALYGFPSNNELELFKLLISVNGIGPKGALGILSAFSANELRFAIYAQDVKKLSQAPGVGKKTAERMILDLKNKVHIEDSLQAEDALFEGDGLSASATVENQNKKDAVEALVALGYSKSDTVQAVSKIIITEDRTTESILKEALKFLF